MKIAINAIPLLSPLTGIGKYTLEIANEMQRQNSRDDFSYFYGYFSSQLKIRDWSGSATAQRQFTEQLKKMHGARRIARLVRNLLSLSFFKTYDLYFEPNFIPLSIRAKKLVVTVADFSFCEHPEWHPEDRIDYFNRFFWKKIGRADRIIVISDYIKRCAVEYGLPEEKLSTVHLGYDREIFHLRDKKLLQQTRLKYNLPDQFVLFVGSIEPRKNLQRLLKAYLSLDSELRCLHKLVLVGFKGWENLEVMNLLKQFKQDVIYTGYITEQELADIYNMATLFAYPSLYEGFGLPPLEAMACGCPVLTSNVTSLPEVCGDAACYVNPEDEAGIADELARLLRDSQARAELKKRGLQRAELFSWERSAQEHMAVFRQVAEGSGKDD